VSQFNSSLPFGVVCHDAGGANQIAAMLLVNDWSPIAVVAKGPAADIWKNHFPDVNLASDLSWISSVSSVITGTGWATNLEHQARLEASLNGTYSISVLDHWTNYKKRFNRNGLEIIPDEIWVVDLYAEKKIVSTFPNAKVKLIRDFYSERTLSKIKPIDSETPSKLLYLLEPIINSWGRHEIGEFQALSYFLQNLSKLELPEDTEVHLRLHPSEKERKYNRFLKEKYYFPVKMSSNELCDEISSSKWVAGCNTYAMTIALKAGRVVYGTLPPWGPECILPHEGIIHLRLQNWDVK